MPRFHCPLPMAAGAQFDLPAGAARHVQVLRLQPGDAITLFNGAAAHGQWQAQIVEMGRSHVQVRLVAHEALECEHHRPVHLLAGITANERMDWLIEKATDLYRMSYAVKGSHECAVFPGVPQMLQTLKDAGFLLCTATSKPTKVVTPILEEQGLAPYFDFIGGASMDESRDTKTEVVRYVLSQPALQGKRVLMVGDRNDDMRGAADCGLDAAGVLYGYGSREELEAFHPVLLAESCADLTDRLLAARV